MLYGLFMVILLKLRTSPTDSQYNTLPFIGGYVTVALALFVLSSILIVFSISVTSGTIFYRLAKKTQKNSQHSTKISKSTFGLLILEAFMLLYVFTLYMGALKLWG